MSEANYFDIWGTLEYSPKRLGEQSSPNWWLTAKYKTELGKYFRRLYELSVYRTAKLLRPAWAEHVSIIRNEVPSAEKQFLWEKWSGQMMWTRVYLKPKTNGEYYWFDCYCPMADNIRKELGLGTPCVPYHLSFGRAALDECC